jgi:hypothetical protein
MNCFLSPIQNIVSSSADKVFISTERKLVAVTADDGSMKIFSILDDEFNLSLVKDIKDHQAPIMSVQFSSLVNRNYVLTAGYDKVVNIYNIEESKSTAPVFTFIEDKKDIGFFTSAVFASTDRSRLRILIGTSTGDIISIDSINNFEPKYYKPIVGYIKSISASNSGDILVSVTGKGIVLFTDEEFSFYIEFGSKIHLSLKINFAEFAHSHPYQHQKHFFTAGEDGRLAIWKYISESKEIVLEEKFDIEGSFVGAFWGLSGQSLSVLFTKKTEDATAIEMVHISKALDTNAASWRIENVNVIS